MKTLGILKRDRIEAMKAKDTVKKNLISVLIGEVEYQVMKKKKVSDQELESLTLKTIKKQINTNNDVLKVNVNPEKKDELNRENEILESYLPKMKTEDEIKQIVEAYKLQGLTELPQIMAQIGKDYPDTVDRGLVRKFV